MAIDLHVHYVDISVIEALESEPMTYGVRVSEERDGYSFVFPNGEKRIMPYALTKIDDYEKRPGIEISVLSPWIELSRGGFTEDQAAKLFKLVNEGLFKVFKRNPKKFLFLVMPPLQHTKLATSLLEEYVQKGAKGVFIGTNVNGVNLDANFLEPIWDAAERLNVPIVLHPVNVFKDRLEKYYLQNLLGNPFDTTIAATSLIFGGVLDRHPNLRVVLVHGGGFLPWVVGRLDHGYIVRSEAKSCAQKPSSYLKRFYYDTVVYKEEILSALIQMVGIERVVFGTDYPFDMQLPNALDFVKNTVKAGFKAIAQENPKTLLSVQ